MYDNTHKLQILDCIGLGANSVKFNDGFDMSIQYYIFFLT